MPPKKKNNPVRFTEKPTRSKWLWSVFLRKRAEVRNYAYHLYHSACGGTVAGKMAAYWANTVTEKPSSIRKAIEKIENDPRILKGLTPSYLELRKSFKSDYLFDPPPLPQTDRQEEVRLCQTCPYRGSPPPPRYDKTCDPWGDDWG